MKSIYLIGAMKTCGSKSEKAKGWRNQAQDYFSLLCPDFECIYPTEHCKYGRNDPKSDREAMRFDLRKVRESDIILVNLKNIKRSIGSCDAIFYAYMLGKPIIGFIEDNLAGDQLINYVHEWKYETSFHIPICAVSQAQLAICIVREV